MWTTTATSIWPSPTGASQTAFTSTTMVFWTPIHGTCGNPPTLRKRMTLRQASPGATSTATAISIWWWATNRVVRKRVVSSRRRSRSFFPEPAQRRLVCAPVAPTVCTCTTRLWAHSPPAQTGLRPSARRRAASRWATSTAMDPSTSRLATTVHRTASMSTAVALWAPNSGMHGNPTIPVRRQT